MPTNATPKKDKKPPESRITLKGVRLSFADIYKPRAMKKDDGSDDKPRYHANFLMEKGTDETKANLASIKKAATAAKKKKFGEDESKWPKLKPDKVCLRNGDEESWDGYENMHYLSAGSEEAPILRARDNSPATPGLLYAGCYVNAMISIWAQNNKYGKRINARLIGVQFLRHGEPFGEGHVDPDSAFEDESEEGDVTGFEDDAGGEEGGDEYI